MDSKKYPSLAWWINTLGWIELGASQEYSSLVRVFYEDTLCHEDEDSSSLDSALEKAESWLSGELLNRFGETTPPNYDELSDWLDKSW